MEALQPLVQGDMAALHDGLHGDAEILAAKLLSATEHAIALRRIGMVDDAAMRANRTIGPKQVLKILAGRFVVAEMRG